MRSDKFFRKSPCWVSDQTERFRSAGSVQRRSFDPEPMPDGLANSGTAREGSLIATSGVFVRSRAKVARQQRDFECLE
jgi:hypothetical protein